MVHPFVEANFPDCPAWFNEGLGSLYEQCAERVDTLHVGLRPEARCEREQQGREQRGLATKRETTRQDAAGVILYAAEKATWVALQAIQAMGGMGYVNETPTGRLLRDAKLYEIGAGTSEIRRMLIGRELFAESA